MKISISRGGTEHENVWWGGGGGGGMCIPQGIGSQEQQNSQRMGIGGSHSRSCSEARPPGGGSVWPAW